MDGLYLIRKNLINKTEVFHKCYECHFYLNLSNGDECSALMLSLPRMPAYCVRVPISYNCQESMMLTSMLLRRTVCL